jgi:P-type Ca2+ transporter type 2C
MVITGDELAAVERDSADLRREVGWRSVFARIAPLQKLTIVRALQEAGESVAVTGDGVNDAPALAAAEIGVAMGRGGTDVARRAADLILADNDFAGIVAGIREGRIAYANIRKVVWFVLSTAIAEVLLFFACLALGLPLPLVALQLLWINVVTDTIQHVALALEPAERDVMTRGPRRPEEPLFDRRLLVETVVSAAAMALLASLYFAELLDAGRPVEEARNLVVLLMVLFENAQLLSCRSETRSVVSGLTRNPWIWIVIALTQAVHVGAMFTPGLRDILGLGPVSLADCVAVLGLALLLVATVELAKRSTRRL